MKTFLFLLIALQVPNIAFAQSDSGILDKINRISDLQESVDLKLTRCRAFPMEQISYIEKHESKTVTNVMQATIKSQSSIAYSVLETLGGGLLGGLLMGPPGFVAGLTMGAMAGSTMDTTASSGEQPIVGIESKVVDTIPLEGKGFQSYSAPVVYGCIKYDESLRPQIQSAINKFGNVSSECLNRYLSAMKLLETRGKYLTPADTETLAANLQKINSLLSELKSYRAKNLDERVKLNQVTAGIEKWQARRVEITDLTNSYPSLVHSKYTRIAANYVSARGPAVRYQPEYDYLYNDLENGFMPMDKWALDLAKNMQHADEAYGIKDQKSEGLNPFLIRLHWYKDFNYHSFSQDFPPPPENQYDQKPLIRNYEGQSIEGPNFTVDQKSVKITHITETVLSYIPSSKSKGLEIKVSQANKPTQCDPSDFITKGTKVLPQFFLSQPTDLSVTEGPGLNNSGSHMLGPTLKH